MGQAPDCECGYGGDCDCRLRRFDADVFMGDCGDRYTVKGCEHEYQPSPDMEAEIRQLLIDDWQRKGLLDVKQRPAGAELMRRCVSAEQRAIVWNR